VLILLSSIEFKQSDETVSCVFFFRLMHICGKSYYA
jgi:hypothetical protein